jgi:hypothetical protein
MMFARCARREAGPTQRNVTLSLSRGEIESAGIRSGDNVSVRERREDEIEDEPIRQRRPPRFC